VWSLSFKCAGRCFSCRETECKWPFLPLVAERLLESDLSILAILAVVLSAFSWCLFLSAVVLQQFHLLSHTVLGHVCQDAFLKVSGKISVLGLSRLLLPISIHCEYSVRFRLEWEAAECC